MSFPASIISESKLRDFLEALSVPAFELAEQEDSKTVEVVRNGDRLLVAVSKYLECEGHIVVKWRLKKRWFGSSKALNDVLQTALSKAEAAPIERFVPPRKAHS